MAYFDFNFSSNSQVYFGSSKVKLLPKLIKTYGSHLLLITGSGSFQKTRQWPLLLKAIETNAIKMHHTSVKTEPSPSMIDEIARTHSNHMINVVVAIGGGSVIDAGKAVSAMLTKNESVVHYLDDIGDKIHDGIKIPFIAVPTTSGTGSEATKNAVLTQMGHNGFKKSLRHDNFVPDIAVIDPELTLSCPASITAACGMDALTQLLGSYVSLKASPMTDSLAISGLEAINESLVKAVVTESDNINIRVKMSYASYISGLTLANAGLGVVHGFASVIGGLFPISHGVICGTLLAESVRQNIEHLIQTNPDGTALMKYSKIGNLFNSTCDQDLIKASLSLADTLDKWTKLFKIPSLLECGVSTSDIDKIVASTGQKNNPVLLSDKILTNILKKRVQKTLTF